MSVKELVLMKAAVDRTVRQTLCLADRLINTKTDSMTVRTRRDETRIDGALRLFLIILAEQATHYQNPGDATLVLAELTLLLFSSHKIFLTWRKESRTKRKFSSKRRFLPPLPPPPPPRPFHFPLRCRSLRQMAFSPSPDPKMASLPATRKTQTPEIRNIKKEKKRDREAGLVIDIFFSSLS